MALQAELEQMCGELYRLIERDRVFLSELTDQRYADSLRKLQRQLFIKKASILARLKGRVSSDRSIAYALNSIMND